MLDLLDQICKEIDTVRSDKETIRRKQEELCGTPECEKFKFYKGEMERLTEEQEKLTRQRLDVWVMYQNGWAPDEDAPASTFGFDSSDITVLQHVVPVFLLVAFVFFGIRAGVASQRLRVINI